MRYILPSFSIQIKMCKFARFYRENSLLSKFCFSRHKSKV